MKFNRKLKRFTLISALELTDPTGVESLGVVIDINVEGMCVQVTHAFEVGRTYDLRVRLPTEIQGTMALLLKARCRRSERTTNPDLFEAGMAFEDMTLDIEEIIEEVVRRFAR